MTRLRILLVLLLGAAATTGCGANSDGRGAVEHDKAPAPGEFPTVGPRDLDAALSVLEMQSLGHLSNEWQVVDAKPATRGGQLRGVLLELGFDNLVELDEVWSIRSCDGNTVKWTPGPVLVSGISAIIDLETGAAIEVLPIDYTGAPPQAQMIAESSPVLQAALSGCPNGRNTP